MSASWGLPHLAAAVDLPEGEDCAELVGLAERGGLDFVTLGGGGDVVGELARVAGVTRRVGLVALSEEGVGTGAAIVGLDRVSRGRGGGLVAEKGGGVPQVEGGACPLRVVDAGDASGWDFAARYGDVALVRVVGAGEARVVRERLRARAGESGRDPDALRVLAALLIDLGDGERAAVPGHGGGGPRASARGPLYRGGPVDLAELIAGWYREGAVDGFHLTPVEPRRDLERLVNGTVALLQHRGLFRTFYPGTTLREHLGLGRQVRAVPGVG
ncbi:LLM class flavin-dependent oxidoreductase [Streptomyces roseirectus]|uniref:LLM class flavin-dependent oxidoreductase n=1 Tax=Streptomyces roseirectus TaxID=2768066 RepID=A0A7H0ILA2_9ACTN|nr:LLM class flavin-dependent oxidoreductase [Streptomyces roseirectus]QNP73568.1 LLM class flavin-dependent oxidoreductase [Streptomyces roseirectus]